MVIECTSSCNMESYNVPKSSPGVVKKHISGIKDVKKTEVKAETEEVQIQTFTAIKKSELKVETDADVFQVDILNAAVEDDLSCEGKNEFMNEYEMESNCDGEGISITESGDEFEDESDDTDQAPLKKRKLNSASRGKKSMKKTNCDESRDGEYKLSIKVEENTVLNNSFSEDQHVTHAESATFAGMVTKFSKIIEPMFLRLTHEVNSMRQEINYLRNEIKELKKDKFEVKFVIPDNPFKIMGEFLKFENLLQEDKKFLKSFEKELLTVAKSPNFTKNCWRKLLTDELAEHLCWKGTAGKKSARSLNAARAIRNAAISIGVLEDEFVRSTKSFFQFAKSRQEIRKKYVAKTKKNFNL